MREGPCNKPNCFLDSEGRHFHGHLLPQDMADRLAVAAGGSPISPARGRPRRNTRLALQAKILKLAGIERWRITEYLYRVLRREPLDWDKRNTSTWKNPAGNYADAGVPEADRLATTNDLEYAARVMEWNEGARKAAEIPNVREIARKAANAPLMDHSSQVAGRHHKRGK